MKRPSIKDQLSGVPNEPGVYYFSDKEETILYVGKAKNLKRRVSSYFSKTHNSARLRVLVKKIVDIKFTIVGSEQEALLLENAMIKENKPRYNVLLKDDKSFPFICIKNERFPRVFLTRNRIKDGSQYLGPYTSVRKVRNVLEFLHQMFPLRNCSFNLTESNIQASKFKVCLEYHIGNCLGPCEGHQNEAQYMQSIQSIKNILIGNYSPVIAQLKKDMKAQADAFEYEAANKIKERLDFLDNYKAKTTIVNPKLEQLDVFSFTENENRAYVNFIKVMNGTIIQTRIIELVKKLDEAKEALLELAILEVRQNDTDPSSELVLPFKVQVPDENTTITVPQIGDKKKLLDLALKNVLYYKNQKAINETGKNYTQRTFELLEQIKADFRMKELPEHIECFDNSNFQGSNPVAACVVFRQGKPYKKDYRHFNIKTVQGPDDFASMKEVVFRRYKRLMDEGKSLPQLIIIDGGKGQLSASVEALRELGIYEKVVIAGIAKRLEEIYFPEDSLPLYIDKRSRSLKVVQQLRNEAHRFAITFHRKKRSHRILQSEFTQVPGIGNKTAENLLMYFKSADKIKKASMEELLEIVDKKKAKAIFDYFRSTDLDQ